MRAIRLAGATATGLRASQRDAGDRQMAGYNPPWTIPMLRRNEFPIALASCP